LQPDPAIMEKNLTQLLTHVELGLPVPIQYIYVFNMNRIVQ